MFRRFLSFAYPRIMAGSDHRQRQVAVVKQSLEDNKFTFSFFLNNDEPKISKQFNMCRGLDEPMASFLSRLEANLDKVVDKKAAKKKKAKLMDSATDEPVLTSGPKVSFALNDQHLEVNPEVLVKDFLFKEGLTMSVLSDKNIFSIDIDPPICESAKLPQTIMAGFMVYPFKVVLSNAETKDSKFLWLVSDPDVDKSFLESPKVKWHQRHEGFFYNVTNDNINRYIKMVCQPQLGSRIGVKFEVISKAPIEAGPGACPFEERHQFTQERLRDQDQFRVVTYNLLADLYADSDFSRTVLHPQCPPHALAIDYRKLLIAKELLGYNADIIALQEVDEKVFKGDLVPVLDQVGFEGAFERKGGQVSEGCAIFFHKSKFRQLGESRRLVMAEKLDEFPEIKKSVEANDKLKENFTARTTTLQTVILESVDGKIGLVVGNTHLFFKPDADHIRLLQIGLAMTSLTSTLEEAKSKWPEKSWSLVLCGDFNSTPPFGVLEFMRNGMIAENHPDWNSAEGEQVVGLSLNHGFKMDSACGTPKYTNFTMGFRDCIDYIFYQTDRIQVTNVVPFPLEEDLEVYQGLPNIVYPSDHIACIADLKFI